MSRGAQGSQQWSRTSLMMDVEEHVLVIVAIWLKIN